MAYRSYAQRKAAKRSTAKRARRNPFAVKIEENVSQRLKAVGIKLDGMPVAKILHAAADIQAERVRALAPTDTGRLREGVYTASIFHNYYRSLTRPRNGQQLTSPLRFPPRPKQAVIASSVFYTRWVERGRKTRMADPTRGRKASRSTVGRMKRTGFLRKGMKATQAQAQAYVTRELERLIQTAWENGK